MAYTVEELQFAVVVRGLASKRQQEDFDKKFPHGADVTEAEAEAFYLSRPYPDYVRTVVAELTKTADIIRPVLGLG